jgi:tripartite-type tricarboxylate transporter receptor subunit TctC
MNFAILKSAAAALALTTSTFAAHAQEWEPSGPIKMMIGFQAGGGVDTVGRLLAEELGTAKGWEIIPENVVGRAGGALAVELKGQPADGLALGVLPTEALTYGILAAQNAGYALEDFTYISTITGTQMGIIAKADRGWKTLADVIEAAKAGETITAGAMSPYLADGLYLLGQLNGVEFRTVMVDGGRGGLNGVVADDLDIAWAAGVQTADVNNGTIVNLASGETKPLKVSPDAPLLSEFGVEFIFGPKFMVIAPAGLPDDVRATLADAMGAIVNDPNSQLNTFITKAFSGPEAIQGAELDAFIQSSFEKTSQMIEATAN